MITRERGDSEHAERSLGESESGIQYERWGHPVTNFGVPDAERASTADAMNARLLVLAFGLLASTRAETPALVLQRPEAKSDGSTPEWGARAS